MIARSWGRAPGRGGVPEMLPESALAERQRENDELPILGELLNERLLSMAGQAENQLVVTDGEGYILSVLGPRSVRRQSDGIGFVAGARWREADVGTNGIGTAMAERAPVQVFGPEHGREEQHAWVCTSAPIINPVTGELAATVTLAGSFRTAHPHTLALVSATAREAEGELLRLHQLKLNELRGSVDQPVENYVLVDEQYAVAASRGFDCPGRLSVIGGLHEGSVWVRDLGAMNAESVPGGWLLRPIAAQSVLELCGGPLLRAVIWVGSERTEVPLNFRHWRILQVLASHAQGVGLEGLRELWDEPVTPVTVRAEVSRLRAKLGGIIVARPYRLTVPVVFSD
ncbi:GAF domain-containing protein [Glutamicibacter sp. NPDC087344]|uniref:helix-turn-helix domain-containing protein n=1 Tax=Glutamicibacter sp. NPDC087344 TaxID=3363994 RepID=UPI0038108CC3